MELAALLGGYFTRQQFNTHLGKECGALAQRFVDRACRLGHVRSQTALGNRLVYHVSSKLLFVELGEPENRNRRDHRPETIRRRLMALDFCLMPEERQRLLTEAAKVSYFVSLGLDKDCLPSERFSGNARRFFVDKQPVAQLRDGSPEIVFIDEGLQTLSQWNLFLAKHRELLRRLDKVQLVYASASPSRFDAAEQMFRRTIAGQSHTGAVDMDRLKRYFLARQLFEERRFESFDQARMNLFREDKLVFSGDPIDALYRRWRETGVLVIDNLYRVNVDFRSILLPRTYEWLSPLRIPERRAAFAPNSITTQKTERGRNGQTR